MKDTLTNYVELLGPPVTTEEHERRRSRRTLLNELGLSPIGYTRVEPQYEKVHPGRFSTHYESEHQFLQDKCLALKHILETGNIPGELYYRIKSTLVELQPIYGDRYNHMY